uniref:BED-type domain-containing protein n=1 Tax=Ascaris lumbricoides TaxID=6252 RepID=A0A0M3IRX2_ASCLU
MKQIKNGVENFQCDDAVKKRNENNELSISSNVMKQENQGEELCTSQKRKRSRTSFVWNMVEETVDEIKCSFCGKLIKTACVTNITAHMARQHPKQLTAARATFEDEKKRQAILFRPLNLQQDADISSTIPVTRFIAMKQNNKQKLERLLTLSMGTSNTSMNFVENLFFKVICSIYLYRDIRLLEIESSVNTIFVRHKITPLSPTVIEHIDETMRLLRKFYDMVTILQCNNRPTISHILPAVLELKEHLNVGFFFFLS